MDNLGFSVRAAALVSGVAMLQGCFTSASEGEASASEEICASLGKECGEIEHEGETYDCGGCADDESCGLAGLANTCCIPASCEDQGAECGEVTDGCGNILECGSCDEGSCGASAPNRCGGTGSSAMPTTDDPPGDDAAGNDASNDPSGGDGDDAMSSDDGGCTPMSCAELGAECGVLNDGCSSVVQCGECDGEATCGGDGVPFQCDVAGTSQPTDELVRGCFQFPVTSTNFVRRSVNMAAGDQAVDFTLNDLEGNPVTLSTLLETKAVVLQTGSYTCPAYQNNRAGTESLAAMFGDDVHFVVVYTPEAHPATEPSVYGGAPIPREFSDYEEATSYAQRVEQASAVTGIPSQLMLIDDFDNHANPVWCTYGTSPNSGFLINRDGVIELVQGWYNINSMRSAIQTMLAN